MLYKQAMVEHRIYDITYYVEANSIEEAKEKIAIGDTVKEEDEKLREVSNRDEWDYLKEVPIKEAEELKAAWKASN